MALDLPTSLGPPPTLSTTDLPSDDEADDLDFAPDAAIPAAGPTSPSSEPDSDDDPAGPSIASSSRPSTRSTKRRRSRSASPPAGRSGEGGEDANADATPVLGYAELLAAAAAKGKGRAVEGVEEPRMVTIKVPRKFAGEVFLYVRLSWIERSGWKVARLFNKAVVHLSSTRSLCYAPLTQAPINPSTSLEHT